MNLCLLCSPRRVAIPFKGICDHCGAMAPSSFREKIDDLATELLSEGEALFVAAPVDLDHSIACIKAVVRRLEVISERTGVDA